MNALNPNSFLDEVMGIDYKTTNNTNYLSKTSLFSKLNLHDFLTIRINTISSELQQLGKDLVVYIDPGKYCYFSFYVPLTNINYDYS